jgi:hypothetical protein
MDQTYHSQWMSDFHDEKPTTPVPDTPTREQEPARDLEERLRQELRRFEHDLRELARR